MDYSGIVRTHAVEVGTKVVIVESTDNPVAIFNVMECQIPASKYLDELFNAGFYLTADVLLYRPSELFIGAGVGEVITVIGTTEGYCAEYPCQGALDMKWQIGNEPTMAEFLQMLKLEPVAGEYPISFVVGYKGEDGVLVPTDELVVTMELKGRERETKKYGVLIGSAALIATGTALQI